MIAATTVSREDFGERLSEAAGHPPAALVMVDIDEFLEINQRYGRAVGDKVIALVEKTLARSLPKGSVLSRLGGDEFAVVLPGTTPEEALILAEEIRGHLDGRRHPAGDQEVPVRLSMGIAGFPQHADDPARLREAAQAALHRAKVEGRNRVAIYVEDRMVLKSNYYPKAQLARLSALADRLGRTEASLLREALADLFDRYRREL